MVGRRSWPALLALLCTCGPPASERRRLGEFASVAANPELDVLYVIDGSSGMAEPQLQLSLALDAMLDPLRDEAGELPNLHIGVVSADLGAGGFDIPGCQGSGDGGKLQNVPRGDCDPPTGAFIQDTIAADGVTRVRNYGGELGDVFACIARLGTGGCAFEQPLASMQRALDGSNGFNAQFLRAQADLAVIFLTDEDDCSAIDPNLFDPEAAALGPPTSFRCAMHGVVCDGAAVPPTPGNLDGCASAAESAYLFQVSAAASFLDELKPASGAGRVFVAAIAGTPELVAVALDDGGLPVLAPSCSSAITEASPAVRLAELLSRFPGRSHFVSICHDDLAVHIAEIGDALARFRAPARCLTGDPTDRSEAPGLQVDCVVREHAGATSAELPECLGVASLRPCYRLAPDDRCTATAAGLALTVVRDPPAPRNGLLEIECR